MCVPSTGVRASHAERRSSYVVVQNSSVCDSVIHDIIWWDGGMEPWGIEC